MGARRYCQVGIETGFGAGAGSYTAGYTNRASFDFSKEVLKEETIEQPLPVNMLGGPVKISGTVEANMRYDVMLPEIFMSIFGSGGYTVTGESAPYTHCWTPDEVDKSLEIKIGETEGDVAWELTGCGVNSLELTVVAGEIAKWSADFIAKDVSKGTFSAPSYTDISSPLTWVHASLKNDAVDITNVKSASVKVDRSLDEDKFEIGSVFRTGLGVGGMGSITGTLEFSPTQIAELRRAFFGAVYGTLIDEFNTLGQIFLVLECKTATDYGVTVSLPITFYTSSGVELSAQDTVERKVEFEAVMDDDHTPTFCVMNDEETYLPL